MMDKVFSPETYSLLGQWAIGFCKNLLVAVIVYFIGRWIIKWAKKLFTKMLERSKTDPSLYSFLTSIVNVVLWLTLIIIIISILGIETSSFIALFASAGMAIGMALSGTLQNFAGGVMILLFKPFKVGDFIEAQGYAGTVKEIQIFNTIIRTNDAQTIIIPNGGLSTGSLKNYSTEPYRRVDTEYQFAYGTDLELVKQAIGEIQQRNDKILKGPVSDGPAVAAPWIGLTKLGDSGVVINTRSWCKSADYWSVFFYMNETVYQELKERGFMFPFNRMDVNILKS
ncbi:MAG: mechanosensitive ion channel [Prevotella sp.]|jgi:small conductance mechanosensitive channel|nr:mechanosensitive ion channel [Prevotella sp.]